MKRNKISAISRRCAVCMVVMLAAFSASCGNNGDNGALPEEENVVFLYNLYAHGDYPGYVAAMASCDSMPMSYRQQMQFMLKMQAHKIRKEKGGVSAVSVARMEPQPGDSMVNVYLNVVYKDSTEEEILFPVVKKNGEWRIR